MSLTDPQFIAWLASTGRRTCVLVEAVARISGVETTLYYSNTGYTTGGADTPAHTNYRGVIAGGARITERLSLAGAVDAGMSVGEIEFDNLQGDLDALLGYVWANRSVKLYVGDVTWPRADFRLVFDGVALDLTSRARDVLNLQLGDKLQRLNAAVSDVKLAGATANADRLLPLTFGEVHNVSPLLVDKATLKYQVHNGAIEGVFEVRDNGVVVSATVAVATGTFTLNATPAGVVTCSGQGDKPAGVYSNTVSKLVQRLATAYGKNPLVAGDLDATQLATFDAANTQPVGLYLVDQDNVLAVCQRIAAAVGAQMVITSDGKLRLVKIDLAGTSPTAVSAGNMIEQTLQISGRVPVAAAIKLGYCRNYTVQPNLQTGIPPEHKDLYAQEWLTSTATDSTVATNYKLQQQDDQVDTLLLVKTDADTEAVRRLTMWKTQRTVFAYDAFPELMLEQLGGYQTITHSRFGLAGGVTGQIIAIERDWLAPDPKVHFEVLT